MSDTTRAPGKTPHPGAEQWRSGEAAGLALELERLVQGGLVAPAEREWLLSTAAQLREMARSEVPPGLADQGLADLMGRIGAESRTPADVRAVSPAPGAGGWLARVHAAASDLFRARGPVLAAALGAVLLVQAGVIAVLLARSPMPLESLGGPAVVGRADTALLTVALQPEAREAAIRAALAGAEAQMVAGPSALGLYTVAVPRTRTEASLAALRAATSVVQSAQPARP